MKLSNLHGKIVQHPTSQHIVKVSLLGRFLHKSEVINGSFKWTLLTEDDIDVDYVFDDLWSEYQQENIMNNKLKMTKVQDLKSGQTIVWGGSYRKISKIEVVGKKVSVYIDFAGVTHGIPLDHEVLVK